MFGYIKPFHPQLRVCELELYKAVYCGLCRCLSEEYWLAARFTLSYDFTFAAMLYASLQKEQPVVKPCACPFNPMKKRPHVEPDVSLLFGCDLAMLLLHAKLEDNVEDSGAIASLGWKTLRLPAERCAKKAGLRLPAAKEAVAKFNAAQWVCEHSEGATLDAVCDPTAQMLSSLFCMMSQEEDTRRVLARLGYMLGRYIYLCDAIDDLAHDRKTGSFNPLKEQSDTARLQEILNLTIAEACNAYALLSPGWYKEILDNIMYLGLAATASELIGGRETNERPL